MKIEHIHISGFGKWTDADFDLKNDFQVFFGENESGKSTLKAFLIGIFFGFPRGGKKAQSYEPRSGARYGGAVTIALQSGRYRIERYDRTKSTLTVTSLSNDLVLPNPEKFLVKLFAPLESVDFEQIYSFDESELAKVASLTDEDLEQVLLTYTRPQAQRFLAWANKQAEAGQSLFAMGKNAKRPLNLANRAYKRLQDSRADEETAYASYQQLAAQETTLRDQLANYAAQITVRQSDLAALRQELQNWPIYREKLQKKHAQATPQKSGSQSFTPPSGQPQVERAQAQQIRQLDQSGRFLSEQVARIQAELQQLQADIARPQSERPAVQPIRARLSEWQAVQARAQQLFSNFSSIHQAFEKGLPKRLSKQERHILKQSLKGLTVGAILSGIASIPILLTGFANWLGSTLLVLAAGLAITRFQKQNQQMRILDRFAPLKLDQVLAKQDVIQQANQDQEDFRQLSEKRDQLDHELLGLLVQNNLVSRNDSQYWANGQAARWAENWLAEQEKGDEGQAQNALRLKEALRTEEELRNKLAENQRQLSEALAVFGLSDVQTFYELAEASEQAEHEASRQSIIAEQLGEELLRTLQQREQRDGEQAESRLKEEIEQAQLALDQSQEKERQAQQELANLQSQKAQFERTGGLAAFEQEEENQKTDLKENFSRYLALSLAEEVVKKAFLGKEDQQAQAVLERASAYLAQLTEGSYQTIGLVKGQLTVSGENDQIFQPFELSSGSRDLLFLALRLALASTVHEKEPLPLLVDDALVHLDEKRKQASLALLKELSSDNQILYWTFDQQQAGEGAIELAAH
ncbi:AAA family ATPase [Fructobacillus sp. M1-13]|uniref:AAA family ATPase n=1 Tax=Fructobacillus papyriferae TaxID=2713171 RepID=A0ABS5QPH4_9LACO|nr:AAA family ATPase [Fructobacillus papyriferae]MBS9334792.1 AAA family ATPase [Fructobacillus papyriferae]MCD2158782.1 AAA family ATPase [Fructobacillus papyriferae]